MAYLTKSLFKLAYECPSRLYYADKEAYPSTKDEDSFLKSLAEGGMQIGELACVYHPGGHRIEALGTKDALRQTQDYLEQDRITLYEAAVAYRNKFLINVDILDKKGNNVDLIEVKAKSWDSSKSFFSKNGNALDAKFKPYLYDVAFQYWVMSQAHPEWHITPYLMLPDKELKASTDGLYHRFKVVEVHDGQKHVSIKPGTTKSDLGSSILTSLDVTVAVQFILNGGSSADGTPGAALEQSGFEHLVNTMADYYNRDEQYPVHIGKWCKGCEFNVPAEKLYPHEKSGLQTCFKKALGWQDEDFNDPLIFDIWKYRPKDAMAAGKYKIMDLEESDLPTSTEGLTTKTGSWSQKDRQTLQILSETGRLNASEVILDGLYDEMQSWTYPLYFLDFEGLRTAIPLTAGDRPYKQYAFQFSVHVMQEDGTVTHAGEWLHTERGTLPNIECARALKKVLGVGNSTIFKYTSYETTLLGEILEDIRERESDIPDASELITWIERLLNKGDRELVDLYEYIKQYYYHADTKGSTSIKKVLPALLSSSESLKRIYSKPYNSRNFKNFIWYQENKEGQPVDPYKLLGDYENGQQGIKNISGGGDAMMSWARMQYDDVSEEERNAVFESLLRYCELDTLAMVMIVQALQGKRSYVNA